MIIILDNKNVRGWLTFSHQFHNTHTFWFDVGYRRYDQVEYNIQKKLIKLSIQQQKYNTISCLGLKINDFQIEIKNFSMILAGKVAVHIFLYKRIKGSK